MSRSATKKIAAEICNSQQESTNAVSPLLKPSVVDSGGKFEATCSGNGINCVACTEEHRLIESTMIDLLIQRGPEKTC